MRSITFTSTNTALQNNVINIIFPLVEDETIYGGFATKYRYRCRYTPLYCGRITTAPSSNYAYYDDKQWTSMSDWTEFITSSGSGQNYGKGQFDFEIPQFDYDVALSLQVQVYEDGTGSYYDTLVGDSFTPVFVGFYNRDFQISLSSVERINANEQESIHIQGKIDKTNIFKPYNRDEAVKDSAWKVYCSNMINSFLTEGAEDDPLFVIRCDASLNSRMTEFESQTILSITRTNIEEWYPHSFEITIDIADKWTKFSSQNNVFVQAVLAKIFNENSESFEFYTADLSTTSNVLLLSAAISSFQIKRRGVKAQMLETDNNIGTFSTGAGMFNHSNLVGVRIGPSEITVDPEKGHSIALYDTHATGDVPSNRPSIGFMDDKHNCQASLAYSGGYLVSNVPIKHPGNDPEGSLGSLQSIELGMSNGQIVKIEGYFSVT